MAAFTAVVSIETVLYVNGAKLIYELTNEFISLNNILKSVTKSTEATRHEFEWLIRETKRMGVEFTSASKGFADMMIAANGTKFSVEDVHKTFTAVTGALSLFGKGTAETQGTFRALNQMLNKTVAYSEEVKSQLAEHFPGALATMAKGLNMTVTQLFEKMKTGTLDSATAIRAFTAQITKDFGPSMEAAFDMPRASVNRLVTSVKHLIASVGADAASPFTQYVGKITDAVEMLRGLLPRLDDVFLGISNSASVLFEITTDGFSRLISDLLDVGAIYGSMIADMLGVNDELKAQMKEPDFWGNFFAIGLPTALYGIGQLFIAAYEIIKAETAVLSQYLLVQGLMYYNDIVAYIDGIKMSWLNAFDVIKIGNDSLGTSMEERWINTKASFKATTETIVQIISNEWLKLIDKFNEIVASAKGIWTDFYTWLGQKFDFEVAPPSPQEQYVPQAKSDAQMEIEAATRSVGMKFTPQEQATLEEYNKRRIEYAEELKGLTTEQLILEKKSQEASARGLKVLAEGLQKTLDKQKELTGERDKQKDKRQNQFDFTPSQEEAQRLIQEEKAALESEKAKKERLAAEKKAAQELARENEYLADTKQKLNDITRDGQKAVDDFLKAQENEIEMIRLLAREGQVAVDVKKASFEVDKQIAKEREKAEKAAIDASFVLKEIEKQRLLETAAAHEQNARLWEDARKKILANQEIIATQKEMNENVSTMNSVLSDAFKSLTQEGSSFEDSLKRIIESLRDMVIQMTILKPLSEMLGGFITGAFPSFDSKASGASDNAGMGKAAGDALRMAIMAMFADGGAVGSTGLSHGLYSRATAFPLSSPGVHAFAAGVGILGEAGPELILPAKRDSSGKLGVSASGITPSVNVVVNTLPGQSANVKQENGTLTIDIIEQALASRIAKGGSSLPKAVESSYSGMRRQGR